MSLVSQLNNLTVRVATEFKTAYNRIGSLASLTTSDKASLVAAINEVNAKPSGGGGAPIDDTTPGLTKVYSSSKTQAIVDAKPSINDSAASSSTVYSSSKTQTQINNAVAGKPSINDTTPSTTTVYSASKTDSQINAAVAALVASAPAALDTLKELSDALGGDANFATTMTTALGNRLRVDAAQALTGPQQTQGRANLGVYSTTEIGDPATDFVASFEAALA